MAIEVIYDETEVKDQYYWIFAKAGVNDLTFGDPTTGITFVGTIPMNGEVIGTPAATELAALILDNELQLIGSTTVDTQANITAEGGEPNGIGNSIGDKLVNDIKISINTTKQAVLNTVNGLNGVATDYLFVNINTGYAEIQRQVTLTLTGDTVGGTKALKYLSGKKEGSAMINATNTGLKEIRQLTVGNAS